MIIHDWKKVNISTGAIFNILNKILFNKLDRVDSSGLRLYFTPKLRQHELGILTVGTDTSFIDITIPPQIEGLKFTSNCHQECTSVSNR